MDFYHFFHFFANFFGIFYYGSSGNETERRFSFSQFLGLFQPILAWNEATMVFFDFLTFFLFFWNFLLPVDLERNDNFYFLFLSLFQPVLAWNATTIVFFNFLTFFAISLQFSITCRVGTERNDNTYFLSFSAFPYEFWLDTPYCYF